MTTTTLPRPRDPVARFVLLTLAGAVAWLGVTQPGPAVRAERAQVIMIATPTLATGPLTASQEAPQATEAPTSDIPPTAQPVEALSAPTAEPQVIVQQVVVQAPPEVVYVQAPAPEQVTVDSAPPQPEQTTLEIQQAANEAYKDLPTLQCPCGVTEPNYHPMPRGAGSR